MDRKLLLAMLLGALLLTATFVKADEDDYDDDSEDAGEDKKESDDSPHVKVITTKNWDDVVGKAKYALVRSRRRGARQGAVAPKQLQPPQHDRMEAPSTTHAPLVVWCPRRWSSMPLGVDTARFVCVCAVLSGMQHVAC